MQNGKALLTTSKRSHAMDAQPLLPSALERHAAASGSVVVSAAADKACGYDPEFDLESNFEAIHVAAAPLISDINEVMGVLTVLRGWSKDTRPQQQVVWSDAQYAPFSPCVPSVCTCQPSCSKVRTHVHWCVLGCTLRPVSHCTTTS